MPTPPPRQLQQVNDAIALCTTDTDRESLEALRSDLTELLHLTRETLAETGAQATADAAEVGGGDDDADPLADEFSQFMQEIRAVDAANDAAAANGTTDKVDDDPTATAADEQSLEHIKEKFTRLLGHKCSAPHTHSWGGLAHHNAMVCGLDDSTAYEPPLDERTVCVRIMFTNPTHREMVPCAYYLDGECRFAAGQCRYSHGELVPFGELRDYREPRFERLRRARCAVLVKQPDRVWHRAHTVGVVDDDGAERTVRLRLDDTRREIAVEYADVMPLHGDSDASDEDTDAEDEDDADDGEDTTAVVDDRADNAAAAAMHRSALVEQSLLTVAADRPLGEWEKHTRGFGSRMMQKYGYVIGTGLGQDGAGIVVPISAQVLPAGRSLDHCMALREQANGDRNLFSVERRLKQRQRQQELRIERAYEREAKRTRGSDVFSFMNESVFAGLGSAASNSGESSSSAGAASSSSAVNGGGARRSLGQPAANSARKCYAEHTTKSLNVAGFQLGEEIRRKEQEVQKMSASLDRHAAGSTVHNRLKGQLDERRRELETLRRSEGVVRREQTLRKDKSKLTIF